MFSKAFRGNLAAVVAAAPPDFDTQDGDEPETPSARLREHLDGLYDDFLRRWRSDDDESALYIARQVSRTRRR